MKSGDIPSKREIEEHLNGVGEYVKMDYLSACLKKQLDFDARKFSLNTLAKIYESRGMFSEAGKLMRASASINTTFNGKMDDFIKSMAVFVKAGNYEEAEVSFAKALALANISQKGRLKDIRKDAYLKQAREYINRDKRKHAMEAYERLLEIDISLEERRDAQAKLLKLYEQLGKIREFYNLKKMIDSGFVPEKKEEPEKQRRGMSVDELMGW